MLYKTLNELKENLPSYAYLLINKIEYDPIKAEDKKYNAWIRVYKIQDKIKLSDESNGSDCSYEIVFKEFNPDEIGDKDVKMLEILKVLKSWNDEEFMDIYIELNKLKRKNNNSEYLKQIKYLEEIKAGFETWYSENGLEIPDLQKEVLRLKEEKEELKGQIKSVMLEIKALLKDVETLENQFNNDTTDLFKLKEELSEKENLIKEKQRLLDELKLQYWGTDWKGIYWKSDKYFNEHRKISLGEELYYKLLNKSTNQDLKELNQEIKRVLSGYDIQANELEVIDLGLKTLEYLSEDEFEFGLREIDLPTAIREVIKERYNLKIAENHHESIKFAMPRKIRDERIQELNGIIGNLEQLKSINKENKDNIQQLELSLKYYNKEYKELTSGMIGDFLLKTDIKNLVEKRIETLKNDTGLTYLGEVEYYTQKSMLAEDCSTLIFNKIINNNYDEEYNESELIKIAKNEIDITLSRLDERFAFVIKQVLETTPNENAGISSNKKTYVFIVEVRNRMKELLNDKDNPISLKTAPSEIQKRLFKYLHNYPEWRNVKRVINRVKAEFQKENKKRRKS